MNTEIKPYNYYTALLQHHVSQLQKQFAIRSLGIFGSYVRGEQDVESDLDILIDFDRLPSLIQLIRLEEYLSQLTGIKVDVVLDDGLSSNRGQRIRQEVIWV